MKDKIYLDEKIWYIEDFISKEDVEFINSIDYLKENTGHRVQSSLRHPLYHVERNLTDEEQANVKRWDKIWLKFKDDIKNIFNNNNEYFRDTGNVDIIIYDPLLNDDNNEYAMDPHHDNDEGYVDHDGVEAIVTKGIVLYLTDDYEGGEIFYLDKDIKFKPKSGTLICHSGDKDYRHAVLKFTGGQRIIWAGFVYKGNKPTI